MSLKGQENIKTKHDWEKLYEAAKVILNPREVSPFIYAGGVAAAILTEKGNIYTGVCIDTACSLGMCAERNAVANMITSGENKILKLVCIGTDGETMLPCGSCQEYLMQLSVTSAEIEILVHHESSETMKLKELMPHWWGKGRF